MLASSSSCFYFPSLCSFFVPASGSEERCPLRVSQSLQWAADGLLALHTSCRLWSAGSCLRPICQANFFREMPGQTCPPGDIVNLPGTRGGAGHKVLAFVPTWLPWLLDISPVRGSENTHVSWPASLCHTATYPMSQAAFSPALPFIMIWSTGQLLMGAKEILCP